MSVATQKKDKKKALLAASFAGLLAVTGIVAGAGQAHAADDACYGVNKCKGTGACGGANHTCAGQNACEGKGWLSIDSETCLKIKGGSLEAPAA